MLCDVVVDVVHFEKHLGNKLYDDIYNIKIFFYIIHDMKGLNGNFYLRSNSVIANFNMCDLFCSSSLCQIYT